MFKELETAIGNLENVEYFEAIVNLKIHDDAPDGYVHEEKLSRDDYEVYQKVIEAKNGFTTKSIILYIPN